MFGIFSLLSAYAEAMHYLCAGVQVKLEDLVRHRPECKFHAGDLPFKLPIHIVCLGKYAFLQAFPCTA